MIKAQKSKEEDKKQQEQEKHEEKQDIQQNVEKQKKDDNQEQVIEKEEEEKKEEQKLEEQYREEMEKMIESIQQMIDYQLQDFHSSMWNQNVKDKMQKFIENESQMFVWIEKNKLKISYKQYPQIQKEQQGQKQEEQQDIQEQEKKQEQQKMSNILYIAKYNIDSILKAQNIQEQIFCRQINIEKGMQNIIKDLSTNLIPGILADKKWPDNTKKELLMCTHKFLATLTEQYGRDINKTILYIPYERIEYYIKQHMQQQQNNNNSNIHRNNIINENDNTQQKEVIQRLEVILQQWQKQIKEVLNSQQRENNNSDLQGPLEEIEFWKNCQQNLGNIKIQLEDIRVKKILEFLLLTNSTQVKSLQQISQQIKKGTQQAQENLKYLQILEKPCRQIQQMESKEIPEILPTIFFCIRMLWERCPYYKQEERIANLLRKVSNQLILRCSVYVNLEDLFNGNVYNCMQELNYAKQCGKKWREIYEQNVKIMNKETVWKFEADSIFAQVEAFVQRCNDLKEICEGQIQFARKGKEDNMPYFSGSKQEEVTFILQEIKDSFQKHLQKLKGKNMEKILDIKSTKWHDDYNIFKIAMKNLDNIYINMINLAFDNVHTVEQAIENMVAFRILGQRETIKLHVQKKIEKVNEIVLRELRIAENYVKDDLNPKYYNGKYSGRVQWCKNLLSRVQRIKWLYDKLFWIISPLKDQIYQEYTRIEQYMKQQMQNIYKEFKENNKYIEQQLNRKLDQNILIEQNDINNKSIVPKSIHPVIIQSMQKHSNNKDNNNKEIQKDDKNNKDDDKNSKDQENGNGNNISRIECNFDKNLLCFMEELRGFQKLYQYGIPNYGGRSEEIVDQQYEKLKVFRENVMLVVREYNQMLSIMNRQEQRLFQDHIDKVNKSIIRGIRILRWSSQGTLDNFVKDCKHKCQQLYKSIEDFQYIQKLVKQKIERISNEIKLIDFDTKKVHELNSFLLKQEKLREQSQTSIEKVFMEIERILNNVYDNFINKSIKIQKVWFEFIQEYDIMLEEQFKIVIRQSLQNFLKAIIGDEKTSTNPTQIFKIYIVMHIREGENSLDFDPEIEEFLEKIQKMLNETIGMFRNFIKLPKIMLQSRQQKIKKLQEEYEIEMSKKKKTKYNMKKKQSMQLIEIKEEEVCDKIKEKNYEYIVKKVSEELKKQIQYNLNKQSNKLHNQLEPWRKESFLKMGSLEFESKINMILEKEQLTHTQLAQMLGYYENIQTEISVEKNTDDSICIQVDTQKIKTKLIELNYEEQKILLNKIKEKTIQDLYKIHNKFQESEETFQRNPTDLQKLQDSMQLVENLQQQLGYIEEQLIPFEQKFALLDEYMMVFTDEESQLRIQIREEFENFKKLLQEVKKRNVIYYENYQKDHMKKLETLEKDVREYKEYIIKNRPINQNDYDEIKGSNEKIEIFEKGLQDIQKREDEMQFGFELFQITYIQVPEIKNIREQIKKLREFWLIREKWEKKFEKYLCIQFRKINIQQILQLCKEVKEELQELPHQTQKWECYEVFIEDIENTEQSIKLIELLQEKQMRERHWINMRKHCKENFDQESQQFNLAKILDIDILQIQEYIRQIHEEASNEYKIEKELQKIVERWQEEEIEFDILKSTNDIVINNKYTEHVLEILEENLICLSTLKTNLHAGYFCKEIEKWDIELNKILEIMDLLMQVQKKFVYFNNIFINLKEEIQQLKGDRSNFEKVKEVFLQYMQEFQEDKNTKRNMTKDNIKEVMQQLLQQLEIIQKNMRKYLERKRLEIARFYFLSDEDIFEILGKTKDVQCINKNVKKMFEGIKELESNNNTNVNKNNKMQEFINMKSECGEIIELRRRIEINGDLNYVMQQIEEQMQEVLKYMIYESLQHIQNNNIGSTKHGDKLEKWIEQYPGQILLLSSQVIWTQKTAINIQNNMEKQQQLRKTQNKDVWQIQKQNSNKSIQDMISIIRKQCTELQKKKLVALITIEVHHKDLLENLQNSLPNSFEWMQQLRYYKEDLTQEQSIISIQQQNGNFEYGYEYQGNNGRLVVTPLTDRCYLTLTNALHYKRGGNPQGPAGTGKTETVKDLGKNLGRFVFVYNCSEGIDVKNMKDLFEGFVMTGFWGCFDEFNRIEIEVLSVIAIQINIILEAITQNKETFDFEGKELSLNKNCAIFITMNPGYAGRSELPDNLKNLFRPISMMVPDSSQICRICLQAEGFKCSDILSRKIDSLYKLMYQNLSRQKHYDFGLRGIKTVLNLAGDIRRRDKKQDNNIQNKNNINNSINNNIKENDIQIEQKILISAILSINEPKLINNDLFLFETLLKDLFPEQTTQNIKDIDEKLLHSIDKVMDKMNYDKNSYFVEKLLQLYQTKNSRHGNIIIGESTAGKSSLLKILQQTQIYMNKQTETYILNPKIYSTQEIYGYYDNISEENKLGIFSYMMDQLCNKNINDEIEKWIIFDGPIDTKWIESMNSLLDDNKVLTLLDGNRINLKQNVKIIFEVDELNSASPATVSRCGMVYMDHKELTWHSIRIKWILEKDAIQIPDMLLDYLEDLFDKWVEPLMQFKMKYKDNKLLQISELCEIKNLTILFDIYYKQYFEDQIINEKNAKISELVMINIERVFVYCVIWSIGCNLEQEAKIRFDHILRDIESIFPYTQQVFDYYLNFEKFEFFAWESKLTISPQQFQPSIFQHSHTQNEQQLQQQQNNNNQQQQQNNNVYMVETVDTLRSKYFMQILLQNGIDFLNIGNGGIGKTSLIKNILYQLDEAKYSYNIINMTPGTTSKRLQENMESKLNRTTKKKYRPYGGKIGYVFIDNMSLPRKDEYGYQDSLEFIRYFIEYRSWYDRNTLDTLTDIIDMTCISAMQPSNNVSCRLLNKLYILSQDLPNDKQLSRIYSSILHYNLRDFDADEIKPEIENTSKYIINIFKNIKDEEKMQSTPNKPHYLFSMKDMTRLVQGISMINKLNCDTKNVYIKLLIHETQRVYADKMFVKEDRQYIENIIQQQIESIFGINIEEELYIANNNNICDNIQKQNNQQQSQQNNILQEYEEQQQPILFTNFFDIKKNYALLPEVKKDENWISPLQTYMYEQLQKYNKQQNKQMNLVLFQDALIQICKINRVMNIKMGNLLLIGQGGTGRRSLTRLSAFINGYDIYVKSKSENKQNMFRATIKDIFENIINKQKTYVLLFNDADVKNESILEDINSLLSLGEIPNLYIRKEGRDDFANIKEKLKQRNIQDSDEILYAKFVEIIKQHIHVVFCCTQDKERLRYYTRNYSGLIFNTTQIYFDEWPVTALQQISNKFLLKQKEIRQQQQQQEQIEKQNIQNKQQQQQEQIQNTKIIQQKKDQNQQQQGQKGQQKQQGQQQQKQEKQQQAYDNIQVLTDYFSMVHQNVQIQAQKMKKELQKDVCITQKNFVDFLQYFVKLLNKKEQEIKQNIEKYTNGLQKLLEASANVEQLTSDMDEKKIVLDKKKKQSEEMCYKIKGEKMKSEKEKGSIEEKEKMIQEEKAKIKELADEAQIQLEKALPALEDANKQVAQLDNSSISTIKTFLKTRDKRLELIMFSLMILLREKADWSSVQKNVVDANFLKRLRDIDKDKITEDRIQKLEKFTQQPEVQGNLKNYSESVHILKEYVFAVEAYVKINLDVDPIRKRVMKLNNDLEEKEQELLRLKEQYQKNLKELNVLNSKNSQLELEYKNCEDEFTQLEQRLERSEQLVIGLSSSQESWQENRQYLEKQKEKLLGDVLLSCAIISYFGAFSSEYRTVLLKDYLKPFLQTHKIKYSLNYDFVKFMVEEVEILDWNFKGLPTDYFSIQNAVIVKNSLNWPLLIDPQAQGLLWLQQLEKDNNLIIIDKSKNDLKQVIIKALMDGIPMLLRDFDGIVQAEYESIIEKNIRKIDISRYVFYYDEQPIQYNKNFKFYITTRINNIKLNADLSSKLSAINFSVKQKGLEEQILGVLLKILDEKSENQRINCIKTTSEYSITLKKLEDKILQMLQDERGIELVDDIELIQTLQISREKEEEIKIQIEANKNNLKKNIAKREVYRYVGYIVSELYFTISQLEKIEYVYQFPLDQFIQLFEETLIQLKESKTDFSDNEKDKIRKIDQTFRQKVYKSTSDGLFEKDRLLLAFLMAVKVAPIDYKNKKEERKEDQRNDINNNYNIEQQDEKKIEVNYYDSMFMQEYEFFIQKHKISNRENQEMNPDTQWITQQMWDQIHELNKLQNFQGMLGSFMHSTREWKNIYNSGKPEEQHLPSDWSQKIQGFSLLLLIKVLRPDRILYSCQNYVEQQMGRAFIENRNLNFAEIYKRSLKQKQNTAILVILGPHIDPWPYIENLAKKNEKNIIQISLGKGQISKAKEKVLNGIQKGFWVYLGNIHLSKEFLVELQYIIDYIQNQKKNTDFQLFLSSQPTEDIPLLVLHSSIKITLEPSHGIQSNMYNIYRNLIQEYEPEKVGEQLDVFIRYRKMVFALAWFHSIVNERKRFKTLGWNIAYEFTDSDFLFSEKILREQNENYFANNNKDEFQWDSIRYLLSQINYGGRVTDKWDQRLIDIYAKEYFNEQVIQKQEYVLAGENQENIFEYKIPKESEEMQQYAKIKNTSHAQHFYQQYQIEIEDILSEYPQHEDPSIFGQHINAEINMQIQNSQLLIESLGALHVGKMMQFSNIENPGFDLISFLQEIKIMIPEDLDIEQFMQKIVKIYREMKEALSQPYNTVVLQESEKYNKLLKIIRSDLEQIESCLKGKTLITEEIESMVRDLILYKVPQKWGQFYLSEKSLFQWLQDLNKRTEQIKKWLEQTSLQIYWLGGFVYPSAFLTAILQTTSRQSNIPIDNLEWEFQYIENEANVKQVKDGAYIRGLYLEGAKWNQTQSVIEDADPMKLIYDMPVVYLKPVEKKNKTNIVQKKDTYECPVYIYGNRTGLSERPSYLFSIDLPFCDKTYDEVFWIKRGTALLLQLKI